MYKHFKEKKYTVYQNKDQEVHVNYQSTNSRVPIRIIRTNSMERAIIRMIHAHFRLSPEKAFNLIDLIDTEFSPLFKNHPNREKAFMEYIQKLDKKPWDKIGVNI